jgi:hypothetical protein
MIRQEFLDALAKHGITDDRIVYCSSTKHYRGECSDIYEQFLLTSNVPKETLILHDGGNAYKRQQTSIFESNDFLNHVVYPSNVHQWLSPNGNNLHGCKTVWKEEYYDFENDIEAPLRLMRLIDLDCVNNSRHYFQRNLFNIKRSQIEQVMRG